MRRYGIYPDEGTVDLYARLAGRGLPGGQSNTVEAQPMLDLMRVPDLTHLYPWLFPPPDSFPFVKTNAGVNIADGSTSVLITLDVPGSYYGVVKRFSNLSSSFADSRFSILVNGKPGYPIVDVDYEFAEYRRPGELPGPGILVVPYDSIRVECRASGAALTGVRARIEGYFWPAGRGSGGLLP